MNPTKPCPFCKEQVSISAVKCTHCQSDLRSWVRRHPVISFFILIFVIIPVVGGVLSTGSKDTTSSTTTTTDSNASKLANSLKVGETGYVVMKNNGSVFVAVNKDIYDEMFKLITAKDNDGLTQMVLKGQILLVDSGTPVRVIDSSMFSREVRITSGKYSGQSGWVPAEMTSK